MRFLDLSVPIENGISADYSDNQPQITYYGHQETVAAWQTRYPALDPGVLPNREAYANERISLSTHNGTHVDAPWHYASQMGDGSRPMTIDEIPLDWFYGPGVKIDVRSYPDGYVLTEADMRSELGKIGRPLRAGDIVLINTSAGGRYDDPNYLGMGCGVGREATLLLTRQGVRVAGIDAYSWDAPFAAMIKRYAESGDEKLIFEGHRAGALIPYCHIEKLTNLDQLPSHGFSVACFPTKIRGGSAGWTRAVAIFDEQMPPTVY
ncbi:MAG: cyclase [Pelagibacterium sp. SCN 64-44]|nr:MAG: cyclase [Pelagibacterium sp. SCN 64-44]